MHRIPIQVKQHATVVAVVPQQFFNSTLWLFLKMDSRRTLRPAYIPLQAQRILVRGSRKKHGTTRASPRLYYSSPVAFRWAVLWHISPQLKNTSRKRRHENTNSSNFDRHKDTDTKHMGTDGDRFKPKTQSQANVAPTHLLVAVFKDGGEPWQKLRDRGLHFAHSDNIDDCLCCAGKKQKTNKQTKTIVIKRKTNIKRARENTTSTKIEKAKKNKRKQQSNSY